MDKRPNFIVIHADQLREDCVGISGKRKGIYTPYIDSIGYQGAYFTSCYATCPLCIPQRLSLLTGQMPETFGLYGNIGIPYIPLETTLPTEMRRGGYQTALVGRTMHTYPFNYPYGFEYYLPGDPSSENKNTSDAFFEYVRDNTSREEGGYYGCGAINNSRVGVPFHLQDRFHHTKWTTSKALDFLDNHDPSRPFMLFVGYYAPHSPHNPPQKFFERYYHRDDLDEPAIAEYDVPPINNGHIMSNYVNLEGEELRCARAGYYGNIAFMDSQIGRLIERTAFLRNTYIIFTSDHGDLLGDHYLMQKNSPYEGSSHLPFLIMGPEVNGDKIIENPIGWHDIMPTILDFAGLPIPESCDGESIKPLLIDSSEKVKWRTYIHGECVSDFRLNSRTRSTTDEVNLYYEKGCHYLTDGRYKYIWYDTTGTEQLFDLKVDSKELKNLSMLPEYTEELNKWRAILVKELEGRREGFSDGEKLIAGKCPLQTNDKMDKVIAQRKIEGAQFAYMPPVWAPKIDFIDNLMK